MKLLTLNCHSWQEADQWKKLDILAAVIHEQSYDVVALQEVSQSITAEMVKGKLKANNFGFLLVQKLKELGSMYDYEWDISHIGYECFEEGVALLTKHPVLQRESFFVSCSQDISYWKTRKVVGMTVNYKGISTAFYACHLGWWQDEEEPFRSQMDRLVARINQERPHFLMGDFNNPAGIAGEGYDYVQDFGYFDTYQLAKHKDSGVTVLGEIAGWENHSDKKRIDFIFSSKKVEILTSRVILNGINKPVVSDHFAIEVNVADW